MLAAGVGGQSERLAAGEGRRQRSRALPRRELRSRRSHRSKKTRPLPLAASPPTMAAPPHGWGLPQKCAFCELQVYTRMDATLKELTSLVKEVYPEARWKGTRFNFAVVFTDLKRPGYRVKQIGSTMSGGKGTYDSLPLPLQKFQMGDYLDMAITPAHRALPPLDRMRPH